MLPPSRIRGEGKMKKKGVEIWGELCVLLQVGGSDSPRQIQELSAFILASPSTIPEFQVPLLCYDGEHSFLKIYRSGEKLKLENNNIEANIVLGIGQKIMNF